MKPMSRETRMVYDRWPKFWIEWDAALDIVARQLPWNRRTLGNRAAWLVKHGYIMRWWAELPGANRPMVLITKQE